MGTKEDEKISDEVLWNIYYTSSASWPYPQYNNKSVRGVSDKEKLKENMNCTDYK